MNIERWHAMLQALGAQVESPMFERLASAYSEKHRAYHTTRHIRECLSLLDEFKSFAGRPAEVEAALWFHDAIYQPMSSSNEERSADLAAEFCAGMKVPADAIARIRSHILATRHVAVPADDDARLLVDIDLAILGSLEERYGEFERDVRKEYRWVPSFVYRDKRAAILQSFLDRPRIYHWPIAYNRFEHQARINLARAIQTLKANS
jgi:predicted metal-dependent HD superfamily phosphohydrolase